MNRWTMIDTCNSVISHSAFGVRNYGNNISPINKKILSDIAKEKGLKEYQMYIDLQSESYLMKFKKAK